jgi:hypothetical protein
MNKIPQLSQICDSPPVENNSELSQSLLNTMMAQPRILKIRQYRFSRKIRLSKLCSKYGFRLEPDELDWYCNWLYTPRNDGRPRLLIFLAQFSPNGISSILDRIKQVNYKM